MRRSRCLVCREPIEQATTGRPRTYCSDACRQRAWYQRSKRRPPAHRSEWWTPEPLRDVVLARWPLKLDAAATSESTLVPDYLGPDHVDETRRNALAYRHWGDLVGPGDHIWLNPPYSPPGYLREFLQRAAATAQAGATVVGLLPAATGTEWWWDNVVDAGAEVEYLRGRVAYTGPHSTGQAPMWASAIVVWRGRSEHPRCPESQTAPGRE